MPLASIRLNSAIAYPVVEPQLSWAIGALLIWDKISIIWDPADIVHLREYAQSTPVLMDNGFIELVKPLPTDVIKASKCIDSLHRESGEEPPTNDEFAQTFALHPIKVTGAYWENARRSANGFVHVPEELGALYVGFLAQEMATRVGVPTISMRYEEPLFLSGANSKPVVDMHPSDCIARAALEVLEIKLKDEKGGAEFSCAKEASKDIKALRNLDGWHSWREHICEYLDALVINKPDSRSVEYISSEMRSAIRQFEREASRQKWTMIGKMGIASVGGVVGFFVGALPGAIAGAMLGGASLGIDLFQSREQNAGRRSGWQNFVLETRKRIG